MKALLMVGMQVDLLPGSPAEVPDSQSLVPVLNGLLPKYGLVVAANFWLPANHVIFAANHLWRRPGQTIPINATPTLLHHIFCVQEGFGAEYIHGLRIENLPFTARMGTHPDTPPYSAFFDLGQKNDTGLGGFLTQNGVSELHVAGMPLENEVLNSVLDSIALGFRTILLGDACRGHSEEAFHTAIAAATKAGASIQSFTNI
ncbi:MAG: isochorismatase family protein [Bacteroidetes bacterium]|nr:isochorismatase family protein [Bacteroidota bacterium]